MYANMILCTVCATRMKNKVDFDFRAYSLTFLTLTFDPSAIVCCFLSMIYTHALRMIGVFEIWNENKQSVIIIHPLNIIRDVCHIKWNIKLINDVYIANIFLLFYLNQLFASRFQEDLRKMFMSILFNFPAQINYIYI